MQFQDLFYQNNCYPKILINNYNDQSLNKIKQLFSDQKQLLRLDNITHALEQEENLISNYKFIMKKQCLADQNEKQQKNLSLPLLREQIQQKILEKLKSYQLTEDTQSQISISRIIYLCIANPKLLGGGVCQSDCNNTSQYQISTPKFEKTNENQKKYFTSSPSSTVKQSDINLQTQVSPNPNNFSNQTNSQYKYNGDIQQTIKRGQNQVRSMVSSQIIKQEQMSQFKLQGINQTNCWITKLSSAIIQKVNQDIMEDSYYTYIIQDNYYKDFQKYYLQQQKNCGYNFIQQKQLISISQQQQLIQYQQQNNINNQRYQQQPGFQSNINMLPNIHQNIYNNYNQQQQNNNITLQTYIYDKFSQSSFILKSFIDPADYEYEKTIIDQIQQIVEPNVTIPILEKDDENLQLLYGLSSSYNCSLKQLLQFIVTDQLEISDENLLAIFCGLIQICINLDESKTYYSNWQLDNIILLLDYSQYSEGNGVNSYRGLYKPSTQMIMPKNYVPVYIGLINFDCTTINFSNLIILHENQLFYLPNSILQNLQSANISNNIQDQEIHNVDNMIGGHELCLDEQERFFLELYQISRAILEILVKMKVTQIDQQMIYLKKENLFDCIDFLQKMSSSIYNDKLIKLLIPILQEKEQNKYKIIEIYKNISQELVIINKNARICLQQVNSNHQLINKQLGISINLSNQLAQQIKIIHQSSVLDEWSNDIGLNRLIYQNQEDHLFQLICQTEYLVKFNMLGQGFKNIIKLKKLNQYQQKQEQRAELVYKGVQLINLMIFNMKIWQYQVELGISWMESFNLFDIAQNLNSLPRINKIEFLYKISQIYYFNQNVEYCIKYIESTKEEIEKQKSEINSITNAITPRLQDNVDQTKNQNQNINIFQTTTNYTNEYPYQYLQSNINKNNNQSIIANNNADITNSNNNHTNINNNQTNINQIIQQDTADDYIAQLNYYMMLVLQLHAKLLYEQGDIQTAISIYEKALQSAQQSGKEGENNIIMIDIYNKLGIYYLDQEQNNIAEKYLSQALILGKKTFDPQSVQIMHMLNNLGSAHYRLSKLKEAETEFKDAKQIAEANYGQYHLTLAMIIINISILHCEQDQLPKALEENELAMQIIQQVNQQENEISSTILKKSKTKLSQIDFNRIYQSQQQNMNSNSPDSKSFKTNPFEIQNSVQTKNFLQSQFDNQITGGQQINLQNTDIIAQQLIINNNDSNINRSLLNQKQTSQPSFLYTDRNMNSSFYKNQKMFDPQPQKDMIIQIDTQLSKLQQQIQIYAMCLSNQSDILKKQGQFLDAESYCIQSIDMLKQIYQEDHQMIGSKLNSLGLIYKEQGKYEMAEKTFQKALQIIQKNLGMNNLNVANILCNMGNILQIQGKLNEAEKNYKQGLEIKENILGKDNASLAVEIGNLGNIYKENKELDKAEDQYKRSLEIKKKYLGENHPSLAIEINNLGNIYFEQKDFDQAEQKFTEALELKIKFYGGQHHSLVVQYSNLANIYFNQNNLQKAEDHYIKALKLKQTVKGEQHPENAIEIGNLGALYLKQQNYEKAMEYFLQAIELKEKGFGNYSTQLILPLSNLSSIQKILHKTIEAKQTIKRIIQIITKNKGENHPDIQQWQQEYDRLNQEKLN